jgi:hypothetical protein
MAENPKPDLAARLRAATSAFVQRHEVRARPLAKKVQDENWTVFAFGGVPRGLVQQGARYTPRDLDLVFSDHHFERFAACFHAAIVRRTRFGGLHLLLNGLEIDAWPLSATWAFREGLVAEVSFARLPATTFLNYDGIVIQFATRRGQARVVHASGLEETMRRGALDLELLANPFPALCVVRSLRLAAENQLPLTPRLAQFCLNELSHRNPREFIAAQDAHYGWLAFDEAALRRIRRRLEQHLDQLPLFDFPLVRQSLRWERGSPLLREEARDSWEPS